MSEDLTIAEYSFPRITRNSVISVTFVPTAREITAIAEMGGSIIPIGEPPIIGGTDRIIAVPQGSSRTFTVVPDAGYYIDYVRVDGEPDSARSVYEVSVSTIDRTIRAVFAPVVHFNHTIIATAGSGGSISPAGTVSVPDGDTPTFAFTPAPGYGVRDVLLNGTSIGARRSYQFDEVRENHTITVEFVWVGFPDSGGDEPPPPQPRPTPEPEPGPGPGGSRDVSRLLITDRHIQYIQGVGNNIFEPNRDMTRAEVVQMFFNLLHDQDVEATRRFPDELEGAWHERAVLALAALGIIQGQPDGLFHPEDSITRAEFVAIAARFAEGLPAITDDTPFSDVPDYHWAYRYIHAAVQFEWVLGYGDGTFQPNRNLSRAEAVTIVNRMLGRVADRHFVDEHMDLERFDDVTQTHWAFYDIMEAFDAHKFERDEDDEEHWRE